MPRIFRVQISGNVTPETALAFAQVMERDFKGKKSVALEALIKKALNPFDPSSWTEAEIKRGIIALNGELAVRNSLQTSANKKEPE